jgi:hypothetical protein
MSLLEQLGARLAATAGELPLAAVALAAERLRVATDLLMWVRQESANPVAVPQLTNATEHLEQAGYALRVGQDAVGEYLAAVGLGYAPPPDGPAGGGSGDGSPPATPAPDRPAAPAPELSPLSRWWTQRVNQLADRPDAPPEPPPDRRDAAGTSDDLLRRVAAGVGSGDRERLRRELGRAEAPVGLGMSALAGPLARRLATDLLGHPPGPADVPALSGQTAAALRGLLPRLPDEVLSTLLDRVCRVAAPARPNGPAHPADAAVAGAVLAGVLLRRLGRDPGWRGSPADAQA